MLTARHCPSAGNNRRHPRHSWRCACQLICCLGRLQGSVMNDIRFITRSDRKNCTVNLATFCVKARLRWAESTEVNMCAHSHFDREFIFGVIYLFWRRTAQFSDRLLALRPSGRSSNLGRGSIVLLSYLLNVLLQLANKNWIQKQKQKKISTRPILGPTQSAMQCITGVLFQMVKRQGREADHLPLNTADVNNTWIYEYTSTYFMSSWLSN
jgi:hypothetical protein